MARTPRDANASPALSDTRQAGHHRIFFGGKPARRDQQRAGCDNEGLVRAFQHLAHGVDGVLVDLPILREFREIMNEGQMDGAVRFRSPLAQAVQIIERTVMYLGAQFLQRLHIGIGAGKTQHLMPIGDQVPGGRRADKSGRAGYKYTHAKLPVQTGRILVLCASG